MAAEAAPALRIDVLSQAGRDAPVDYRQGAGAPDPSVHPPVNYWAFSAATGGRFCRDVSEVDEQSLVIVLMRQRNGDALAATRALKARGQRVLLSWKETGMHQIAQQTRWFWQRQSLKKIHALADGAIATTAGSVARYREFGGGNYPVHLLPTPYPVDLPQWDFALPLAQRDGIFIGTRQFDVPTRRHAEALALAARVARATGCRVTVLNTDGAGPRRRIRGLMKGVVNLNLVEQRLSYPDYLRLMAAHRVVLQRDVSEVPGQVAGDALLCRVVNVGGNGAIQEVAFPQLSSAINDDEGALAAKLELLLRDDGAYEQAVAASQARAQDLLSYGALREQLRKMFAV